MTGVQRYTKEIITRIGEEVSIVAPSSCYKGVKGHMWEQMVLPMYLGKKLLWSPGNTGPLAIKKQVVTVHDMAVFDHPEWFKPHFSSWYRFLIPKLVKKVRCVITVSDFTKKRILEVCNVPADKVKVIRNGVGEQFYPREPYEIEEALSRLSIPSHKYILAVGSLEPRKNILNLLNAWRRICATSVSDDLWLVLVGAKGKLNVFADLDLQNIPSRVFVTGRVSDDDLPVLYSGAVASVYLSFYEGFGLPPLESMASGTPALISNADALREVVEGAGICVNPYSVTEISDVMAKLCNDVSLQESLVAKGLERSKMYSWDRCAHQTLTVLKEAAE